MKGYYQLIEGHDEGYMFALRAGNHETILESRVYWSRQAALDGIASVRVLSQDMANYAVYESPSGSFHVELRDEQGRVLGRSLGCGTRGGVAAGAASVKRNAPTLVFRGLVRRALGSPVTTLMNAPPASHESVAAK